MSSTVGRAARKSDGFAAISADLARTAADDLAACRATLRQGSKSFHLASRLLPRRVSEPAAGLYAFCRYADDEVDLPGREADALARLSATLDRVYQAHPADDAMERALTGVVHGVGIPRALLDALLEGLAWDAEGRRFDDLSELRAYGARVASTVGVITTLLMGVRSEQALARAADLGVAMQLTNIARDIGEDARAGRIYLPLSWMREAGLDPDAWLANPSFDHRLQDVVERLLQAADDLYQRSVSGIAHLPLDCRPGIHAARMIYAEIGREVERLGDSALATRAVVSPRRKVTLLGLAIKAALQTRKTDANAAALPETQFLIDAVQASPKPQDEPAGATGWWHVDERIGRTIELFARLEQEERLQRAAGQR